MSRRVSRGGRPRGRVQQAAASIVADWGRDPDPPSRGRPSSRALDRAAAPQSFLVDRRERPRHEETLSNVLVIGPDGDLCALVLLCLESAGHQGRCSVDPDEGVALHVASPFDVVIVDLDLSAGVYAAAIRDLRRRSPDIVIVATIWKEIPPEVALEAGATSTLHKPFDCSAILDRVPARREPPS